VYSGCKNMPEQTEGTGLILKNVLFKWETISQPENFTNSIDEFIITSEEKDFINLEVSFDNGETYNQIDFSKYSLLGKLEYGDCSCVFQRNVSKNSEEKKYIYKIIVISCGSCKALCGDYNCVLIPKVEEDFCVEFVVESKRWNNGK